MDAQTVQDLGNVLGWIVGGGGALFFTAKKIWTRFVGDGIALTTTASMSDMVNLLAEQIKDLAETNTQLRTEIKELRESNKELSIQNMHLQEEVSKLTIQVEAITTNKQ